MQYCVFLPTDIQVYGQPIAVRLFTPRSFSIFCVGKAQVIPMFKTEDNTRKRERECAQQEHPFSKINTSSYQQDPAH